MEIRLKWFYRLGFLLLLFIVLFVFLKLKSIWFPILKIVSLVLFPFAVSAFITYLIHPVIERLHETKMPRWLSILIIYFLFFGGIGLALYKGIPAFVLQLKDLVENAPQFADQYRRWIAAIEHHTEELPAGLRTRIENGIAATEKRLDLLLTKVISSLAAILDFFILIAIIPFIVFYMLKDIDAIKRAVWYVTPRKWRDKGMKFLRDVDESLGGYIRGQLLVGAIVGSASAILFWAVKMKYPLLLGMIVGITNIIPYFGPILALFPIVIIAATMSMKMVVLSVVIVLAIQFVEGNILSPFIVGKTLHMHPLMIMAALLAGGEIGGVLGLILAVPILAVLKVSVIHARNHFLSVKQDKKQALD